MDVPSDQATSICSHCDRAVPSSNLDLHFTHCSRNLGKCKICGDMVPKRHAEEHFLSAHAPVSCSLCNETIEREVIEVHRGESCPQRIVTCEYCEFPSPAVDLLNHQEMCGSRTELCHLCSRYIRLREMNAHGSICNGIAVNDIAESSRNTSEAETDHTNNHNSIPRRPPNEVLSKKRLLFTIAITGIAVLLGSLIFQKKSEQSRSQ